MNNLKGAYTMKYGFGSKKITPAVGVQMEGYQSRYANDIHDDLWTSASFIQNKTTIVLLVSIDIVVVPGYRCDRIKRRLVERFNLKASQIIISANHTHSGPVVSDLLLDLPEISEPYWQLITEQVIAAVAIAIQTKQEVVGKFTVSKIFPDVYGNRNNPEFPYNNQLSEVRFFSDEKMVGSIFLLGSHPTVMNANNLAISGDLISAVRQKYYDVFGVTPFIALTDCGDTSTRYTRKNSDFEEVARLADKIVTSVERPDISQAITFDNLDVKAVEFRCDYDPMTDKRAQQLYQSIQARYNAAEGVDKANYAGFVSTYNHIRYFGHTHFSTAAYIWEFKDIRFIAYPGEIVHALGEQLRNIDNKPTMLITLANDYRGYSVNKSDFGKHFESFNSVFANGMADDFVKKIIASVSK